MDRTIENPQSLLIFHSSGLNCAFPLDAVQEIVPMAWLSRPPGLPSLLAGFLDLRGTAIPIIRLDRLFDLPEQRAGLYTPLIIPRGPDTPVGVLVSSIRHIVSAAETAFLPLPERHTFHDCASATVEVDGDMVHVLCPERILLENERSLLA